MSTNLLRWASVDHLAVHVPGEADLNVYAYVSGQALRAIDPLGLNCVNGAGGQCNSGGGTQGTSARDPYGSGAAPTNTLGFDPKSPAAARAAGAAMGGMAAGVPVVGEVALANAMRDLRGKLDRNVYNAWLQGVVAGAEATAISALATAKVSASGGMSLAPTTGGTSAAAGVAVASGAAAIVVNSQVIVQMAVSDYGKGGLVGSNYEAGKSREQIVHEELQSKHPNASVQREHYLRDKQGKRVVDPVTGEARRVDHAVIEKGKARTFETTSETANKSAQTAKETRIREAGGTHIRDKQTKKLVPVGGVSKIIRKP